MENLLKCQIIAYLRCLCEAKSNSKSGPYVCKASTKRRLCTHKDTEISLGCFESVVFTPVTCNSATLCPNENQNYF